MSITQGSIVDIANAINKIPKLTPPRRNIYDILGIRSKELANSNALAFYFNQNEEHGFGDLFLKSLLELAGAYETFEEKIKEEYEVVREENFVDLIIRAIPVDANAPHWAIVIENKIYHHLHNDLVEYWKRVPVTANASKIGIILSPYGINNRSKTDLTDHEIGRVFYHDLTHLQLIEQVKKNLPEYRDEANEQHLLLLEEYFLNIQSFYPTQEELMTQQEKFKLYHENFDAIDNIANFRNEVRKEVAFTYDRVFEEFGYKSKNNNLDLKHYFYQTEKQDDYYRFFIVIGDLLKHGGVSLYFELHREYAALGDELHNDPEFEALHQDGRFKDSILEHSRNNVDKEYYQIAVLQKHPIGEVNGSDYLYHQLKAILDKNLFNEQTGLIPKINTILEKIKLNQM